MKIRNLILLAFGLLPFLAAAQTATFDRVRVRQGLTIRAEKADSIIRAVTALSNHTSIPTAKAVWDAIAAIVAASKYQTLRDDGSNMTQQPAANFVSTATVAFTLTNDGGNSETEIAASVPTGGITTTEILDGTIANADISSSANIANSKLANSGVTAGTYPSTGGVIPLLTINSKGIITAVSESANVDASATNEGRLGVGAGGSNDALLTSNTSGATGVTYAGGTAISVSETTNTNGGTITITNTGDTDPANDLTVSDTVRTVSAASTHSKYPTAAAVYNAIAAVGSGGPDSTFVLAPGGGYAGKRINSNVYRTGKVSLNTTDTTGQITIGRDSASATPAIVARYKDASNGAFNVLKISPISQTGNGGGLLGDYSMWATNFPGVNTPYSSRANHVWRMGYNTSGGGGRVISTDADLHMAFESNFYNTALNGQRYRMWEWHVQSQDTLDNVHRVISATGAHDGSAGDIGFNSDGFYFSRYNNPSTNWLQVNRFSKLWAFRDSMVMYFDKNGPGGGGIFQRNAAGSGYVRLLHADASDRVALGGSGETSVYFQNGKVEIGGSAEVYSNTSGAINIGKSGINNYLTVRGGNPGDRHLAFQSAAGSNEWVFGISGNDLFMRSETGGDYPWWVDKRGPTYTWRSNQSGDIGLGLYAPAAKLDIKTSGGATSPLFRMRNSGGYSTMYRTTALPEGAITADPGDVALSAISGVGRMWIKESGSGNTGWKELLTSSNGITGSGTANQVTYWSGTQGLTGDADFTYDGTNAVLNRNYTNTRDMNLVLSGNVPGLNFRTSGASFSLFSGYYNANTLSIFHGASTGNPSTNIANFTSDGRVGIGTASPSVPLHVVGNTLTEGRITSQSTGANAALYLSNTTASTGKEWYINSVNAGSLVVGNATTADVLTINGTTGATTITPALTLSTTSGTAASILGLTSGNVVAGVTLGSGLSLSGGTLSATGGSGSPGGSTTQVQYNNSGSFDGATGLTVDGSENVSVTQAVSFSGDIAPSNLSGTNNDYAPTGFSTASTLLQTNSSGAIVTGIAGGADGRWITWHNTGSNDLIFRNENALSTAANRLRLGGGDVTLKVDGTAGFRYDATASRWRLVYLTSFSSGAKVYEYMSGTANFQLDIPAGAKAAHITAVGAGGGGGSGRRGASGSNRCGGGGGAAGGLCSIMYPLEGSDAATFYINVGTGGTGGTAITANSTSGNTGGTGGESDVRVDGTASTDRIIRAQGGTGGTGGTATAGTGGTASTITDFTALAGTNAGANGGAGTASTGSNNRCPGPGAGGGGVTSGGAANVGGNGGAGYLQLQSGGTTNGSTTAAAIALNRESGGGGAGGSGVIAGSPIPGGDGKRGGGGGGGGAGTDNAVNGAAGGNGGDGYVKIVFYF